MKALVRFHIGKKIYEIGDQVPEDVYRRYPQLVGVMFEDFETPKKEMLVKSEKVDRTDKVQKRRK